MRILNKLNPVILVFAIICAYSPLIAGENEPDKPILFQGMINSDGINMRADSTTSSEIICKINKGEIAEVTQESYGWYKIRLPHSAPSFIKKGLVMPMGENTAKVIKDNVNIRLTPGEGSRILGKVNRNEIVNIVGDEGEWLKIEPVSNSFGWIHKKFVDKAPILKVEDIKPDTGRILLEDNIVLEGVIKPYGKLIKRKATHKLIAKDNNIYLLKGNKGILDTLNYHRVKVTGKLTGPEKQRYPVIEIIKTEVLD